MTARRLLLAAAALLATLLLWVPSTAQEPPPKKTPKKTQANKTADPHAGHNHPPGEHPEPKADPHAGHGHAPGAHGGGDPHGVAEKPEPFRGAPWSRSILHTASTIPVQAGGRIKPLSVYAGFTLLKLNGKRKVKTPQDEKLGPMAWLLDTMFFPQTARTYECFRVQNSDVVTSIGLEAKRKRDYYSYEHLKPQLKKLFELAQKYNAKAQKKGGTSELEAEEREALELAKNVSEYQLLLHSMDWARQEYSTGGVALGHIYGKVEHTTLANILAKPAGVKLLSMMFSGSDLPKPIKSVPSEVQAMRRLAGQIQIATQRATGLALLPPNPKTADHDHDHKRWSPIVEIVGMHLMGKERVDKQVDLLTKLEAMEHAKNDPAKFEAALEAYQAGAKALAIERGEYGQIEREVAFYEADYFYRALLIVLTALLLLLASWVFPTAGFGKESAIAGALKAPVALRRWVYNTLRDPLYVSIWGLMILSSILLVTGVTIRCVINSRPPVTTLYETILFVCGCSVITALALEYINRQRIALAVSVFLGAMLLFLAGKYEFKAAQSAGDTLEPMRAVLDTNFWLATHVTTVTLGYAAGLLAAAIGHVWILGKMFGLKQGDRAFYRTVTRMTYGVICFGLLFSVVGTILGGIWANYSWGRFWGWDPKENGALLIVLWELAILHARLGGYLRDHGMAVMAVLGGCVVAFSWWGVNLLNVGLHSYGFTSGVALLLGIFMGIELLLVLASGAWRLGQAGLPSEDALPADEPKADAPKADEPKEEPKADEPKADEPKADEAKADDEPQADEPQADEPTADEPQADEPTADEPTADEPTADEPKADSGVAETATAPEGTADMPEGTADSPEDKKDA